VAEPGGGSPRIEPLGDAALLVTIGDTLDVAANVLAHRIAADLEPRLPSTAGVGRPVPGHASVLVPFDPDRVTERVVRDLLASVVREAAAHGRAEEPGPADALAREIPVVYGGESGPDLADVARRTGLTEGEVVRLHASIEHRVLALGFVPGFPYLGILPPTLELPRRTTPRVRVPPGSVAIAGRQTGIYPFETPGGWHILGRTTVVLWDPARERPALLAPGDRVRFVPG
jgi:KipI family sensor histidine kinase inhibitor